MKRLQVLLFNINISLQYFSLNLLTVKGVLYIPQISRTRASPSDSFVSYTRHTLGGLTPLQGCSRCNLLLQPIGSNGNDWVTLYSPMPQNWNLTTGCSLVSNSGLSIFDVGVLHLLEVILISLKKREANMDHPVRIKHSTVAIDLWVDLVSHYTTKGYPNIYIKTYCVTSNFTFPRDSEL